MSAFEIYLVMQMTHIQQGFCAIGTIGATICVVCLIIGNLTDLSGDSPICPWASKLKIPAYLFAIVAVTGMFLPDSRTVAAMYLLPKLANNEQVQAELEEVYSLAKEGLKNLVKEQE